MQIRNSVKEIETEIKRMLVIANTRERVDIYNAMKGVTKSLSTLMVKYNENYEEEAVAELRNVAIEEGIRMEYCLMDFDDELRERYILRNKIISTAAALRESMPFAMRNGARTESAEQICNAVEKIKDMCNNAQQLVFTVTAQEKEDLEYCETVLMELQLEQEMEVV